MRPLHVNYRPQALNDGSDLLIDNGDFSSEVGMETGVWALDVDAADTFALTGWPEGSIWDHVPGREGAVLSVSGYHRNIGDGVWRFAESTDNGRNWRRTDVRLPLGDKPIWRYADDYDYALK